MDELARKQLSGLKATDDEKVNLNDVHFCKMINTVRRILESGEKIQFPSLEYDWISTQKKSYEHYPEWRKKMLDEIGLNEILTDRKFSQSWEEKFSRAKKYYEENGNLNVKADYIDSSGFRLGTWIQTLRNIRKGTTVGTLTRKMIDDLDSIGMIWNVSNGLSWDEWYELAASYYHTYHNLLVPQKYITTTGHRLGCWINNQRSAKRNPRSQRVITVEQVEKLNRIGMVWENCGTKRKSQNEYPKTPNTYIPSNISNNESCAIKSSGKSNGICEKNPSVAANRRHRTTWEERFSEAEKYYKEHENLNVPKKYISNSGFRLGQWLALIKCQYRNHDPRLTEENIHRLESIGMQWDHSNDIRFRENVDRISQIIKSGEKIECYTEDYHWIALQKRKYENYPVWKKELLDQSGIMSYIE